MANRDEVEEFLRRAAARRAAAQQQQQQRPAAPQPPPQWTPPQQQQPVPQRPLPPPPYQPPFQQPPVPQQPQRRPATLAEVAMLQPVDTVDAELVEVELIDDQNRVGRSVVQHMRATDRIGTHAERLGDEIELADDKLEAHLHQVFDHKVGDLKKSTMEAAAASPSQAARDAPLPGAVSIARMLADPQSLRNAFIMAEILKRPGEDL